MNTKQVKPKLLVAMESSNGKAWMAMFRYGLGREPTYYCTSHTGGTALPSNLRLAATQFRQLAAKVKPKLHLLELKPTVVKRFT